MMKHVKGKKLIPRKYNLKCKVTDEIREAVVSLHKNGVAIREIARRYAGIITRRTISYVIYPERYIKMLEQRRNHKYLYSRDILNAYMRKHRAHKKQLYKMGLLRNRTNSDLSTMAGE